MDSILKRAFSLACTVSMLAGCAPDKHFYRGVYLGNNPATEETAQPESELDQAQAKLQAEIARLEAPAYAAAAQAEKEAATVKNDPDGIVKSIMSVTDRDRGLVDRGTFPSDVLIYDARLIDLVVATPSTIEVHKQDSNWMKKFMALQSAKAQAIKRNAPAFERRAEQQRQFRQTMNNIAELRREEGELMRKDAANRAAANDAYQERLGNGAGRSFCQIPVFGGTGTQTVPCPDGQ